MKKPVIKLSYNAPVTLTFALLCAVALIMGSFTGGASTSQFFSVYRCPLDNVLAFVRFFTHVLGHGSVAHLISNLMFLLLLGPALEDRYGSWTVLWAILFTELVSGLVQYLFFPGAALLGASGIVFMMILLTPFAGMKSGTIPLTLILVAALYLGNEVWDAIFVQDDISQLTHIIGGLCGTMIGFILGKQ